MVAELVGHVSRGVGIVFVHRRLPEQYFPLRGALVGWRRPWRH